VKLGPEDTESDGGECAGRGDSQDHSKPKLLHCLQHRRESPGIAGWGVKTQCGVAYGAQQNLLHQAGQRQGQGEFAIDGRL
jgi:hypothetical protein